MLDEEELLLLRDELELSELLLEDDEEEEVAEPGSLTRSSAMRARSGRHSRSSRSQRMLILGRPRSVCCHTLCVWSDAEIAKCKAAAKRFRNTWPDAPGEVGGAGIVLRDSDGSVQIQHRVPPAARHKHDLPRPLQICLPCELTLYGSRRSCTEHRERMVFNH